MKTTALAFLLTGCSPALLYPALTASQVAQQPTYQAPQQSGAYQQQPPPPEYPAAAVAQMNADHDAQVAASLKDADDKVKAMRDAADAHEKEQLREAREHLRQKREAEAQLAASVDERSADPEWTRPILTAMFCRAAEEKRLTLDEVAKERRLAKQTGVIDLEILREYQNAVRDDDREIETAKRELAARKIKPSSCSDGLVTEIADCLPQYLPYQDESSVIEQCRTGKVVEHLRMSRLFY